MWTMQKEAHKENYEAHSLERKMSFFVFLVEARVVIQQIEKDLTGKPFWRVAETKLTELFAAFTAQKKNFLLGSTNLIDKANSELYLDLTTRYLELKARIEQYKVESEMNSKEKAKARKTVNKSATNEPTVVVFTSELHLNGPLNGAGHQNGHSKVTEPIS